MKVIFNIKKLIFNLTITLNGLIYFFFLYIFLEYCLIYHPGERPGVVMQ
jgi:hypothetical protein